MNRDNCWRDATRSSKVEVVALVIEDVRQAVMIQLQKFVEHARRYDRSRLVSRVQLADDVMELLEVVFTDGFCLAAANNEDFGREIADPS